MGLIWSRNSCGPEPPEFLSGWSATDAEYLRVNEWGFFLCEIPMLLRVLDRPMEEMPESLEDIFAQNPSVRLFPVWWLP